MMSPHQPHIKVAQVAVGVTSEASGRHVQAGCMHVFTSTDLVAAKIMGAGDPWLQWHVDLALYTTCMYVESCG